MVMLGEAMASQGQEEESPGVGVQEQLHQVRDGGQWLAGLAKVLA